MIVAKRKPFEEIKQILAPYSKVLTVGCGTCVSVCLAGGEKEAVVLNTELEMARRLDGNPIELDTRTVERQCDREYLAELDDIVNDYDALISLACGVGIQFLAERYPEKPVLPGVDTTGLAVNQAVGNYEERCRSCGRCVLAIKEALVQFDDETKEPYVEVMVSDQKFERRNLVLGVSDGIYVEVKSGIGEADAIKVWNALAPEEGGV